MDIEDLVIKNDDGGVSEGLNVGANVGANVGVNVGVNELYEIIKKNLGINSKELHSKFGVTTRTIE